MEDKDLIVRLQTLKQIKPRQDWVVLTKNRILANDFSEFPFWQTILRKSNTLNLLIWGERLVFGRAGLATFAIFILMGLFGFVQNSNPGDMFYATKKAILQGETALVSGSQAALHLRVAAESAQAAKEAARTNNSKKLAAALEEYRQNLRKAAGVIDKEPKNAQNVLQITALVNQLHGESKEMEQVLHTEVAREELEILTQKTLEEATTELKGLLAKELQNIASGPLTEAQQKLLQEAQSAFEQGDYSSVVELIAEIGGR
jgi:hypothetical protein